MPFQMLLFVVGAEPCTKTDYIIRFSLIHTHTRTHKSNILIYIEMKLFHNTPGSYTILCVNGVSHHQALLKVNKTVINTCMNARKEKIERAQVSERASEREKNERRVQCTQFQTKFTNEAKRAAHFCTQTHTHTPNSECLCRNVRFFFHLSLSLSLSLSLVLFLAFALFASYIQVHTRYISIFLKH